MPCSDYVRDPDTNYYVRWLEEKTGYDLVFTLIRQKRSEEYLEALFSSEADLDVLFFGDGFSVSRELAEQYVRSGDIAVAGDSLFYPNTGSSVREGAVQILWINVEWLQRLGLSIPETTEELEEVLRAFRDGDPNGNGQRDEIPLAAASDDYAFSPAEFLLNTYVYNDPYHSRYGVDEETGVLKALTDEFREGLTFCRELCAEGLLWNGSMTLSQLAELVNSPADLVGAFTTGSISEVVYQGNPEVMARYVHVAPLAGPGGVRNAVYAVKEETVGALITARSAKKEEAERLLALMLSEEASLIARFGERGVDWDFSDGTDVSIYGGSSTIVTVNYLWNTRQNKHLNGIGPMNVPERYLAGVTWNGVNSDAEYIDGRAQMSYREFLPEGPQRHHERNERLSAFLDRAVEDFISGRREIGSDREWEAYLDEAARYY